MEPPVPPSVLADSALKEPLSSNRAVREWRGYAKDELGVEHQVLEGKIVTAAVLIGMAVANRIWEIRGVKQTTGVTKVVRLDGLQNNNLVGNSPALLCERDDAAYEVLAEKGKRFFSTNSMTLPPRE
eukprot:jgi/Tetstr1/426978/TSEL_017191.t1